MCLIVFAYRRQPGYRLVLAANRDEYLARPTLPLGLHYPGEPILAGRDLRGGGTWLALAADGRYGAITNYRDPARRLDHAPSRGAIILDYLRSPLPADGYLPLLARDAHRYEGFNLLLGDDRQLLYYSNITGEIRELSAGIYGLSNHLLDTDWPKVRRVKRQFATLLSSGGEGRWQEVFALLADRHCPKTAELPDTGVGLAWERMLAPICISAPDYGTRSSSLLLLNDDGSGMISERSYRHVPSLSVVGEITYLLQADGFQRANPPDAS